MKTLQVPLDVQIRANESVRLTNEIKLTSAYHTIFAKRLLVDDVHPAIALQLNINKNGYIPKAKIVECYGTQVADTFKPDFTHIVK